jgi:hypothetical protein
MLDPQVAVNLLPKLGVGVDLVSHRYCLGERFKCAAERERDVASTDLVRCCPSRRAELSEGSRATARGKHQGVLGVRGVRALKREINYAPSLRCTYFGYFCYQSVISIRAKARKT